MLHRYLLPLNVPSVVAEVVTYPPLLKLESADPLLRVKGYSELHLILAALLRHGQMPLLVQTLNAAIEPYLALLKAPDLYLESVEWGVDVIPTQHAGIFNLFDAAALSVASTQIAYCVRYNQLNRKLRKIVKNKYRYQKRFEWVPPGLRARSAVRLFKAYVKTRTELSFADRLAGALAEQTMAPDAAPLTLLARQSQTSAVSALSQTTVAP